MSNFDSPHRSIGFDYCAIAMRQRVLQHIPPESGHWRALIFLNDKACIPAHPNALAYELQGIRQWESRATELFK
jgi:hypothetical protein